VVAITDGGTVLIVIITAVAAADTDFILVT
jgi:hypothetical protein